MLIIIIHIINIIEFYIQNIFFICKLLKFKIYIQNIDMFTLVRPDPHTASSDTNGADKWCFRVKQFLLPWIHFQHSKKIYFSNNKTSDIVSYETNSSLCSNTSGHHFCCLGQTVPIVNQGRINNIIVKNNNTVDIPWVTQF